MTGEIVFIAHVTLIVGRVLKEPNLLYPYRTLSIMMKLINS